MFTKYEIEKLLFFDIETAGSKKEYNDLSNNMKKLWQKRCEYLRTIQSHPENLEKTDSELFLEKAGLQAEFGKVVGISFGRVKFSDDDPEQKPIVQIASYHNEDETFVLKEALRVFDGMHKHKMIPIGHNVKRFDIPFLAKRFLINNMEPALPFQIWDKKPWEINIKDTSELWSFGAWQEGFTSLDLLCNVLDLPSPKDEMSGDQVHYNFYNGNIDKIKDYCNMDVISLIRVIFKLSLIEQFDDSTIIFK